MEMYLNILKGFGKWFGFWALSLLCEVPFYFLAGILATGFEQNNFLSYNWGDLGFVVMMVMIFTFFYRLLSLHLIGSLLLKLVLIKRMAGSLWFVLADFLLANLWIGVWAWLDPHGPAFELFHQGYSDSPFRLTELWFMAIPPIGFGSAAFRLLFGRAFFRKGDQHES